MSQLLVSRCGDNMRQEIALRIVGIRPPLLLPAEAFTVSKLMPHSSLKQQAYVLHRRRNLWQTALLIAAMAVLVGLLGALLLGPGAWLWLALGVGISLMLLPRVSVDWQMRLQRGQELTLHDIPALQQMLLELSRRAGLATMPRLFYVPSLQLNAFAVGDRVDGAIAISEGLLRALDRRELAGVLAHEVAHLAHGDTHYMLLGRLLGQLIDVLVLASLLLLFLGLPAWVFGAWDLPWSLLLLVLLAPTLAALLQLALSRTREFGADLEAARLLGSPQPLINALSRLALLQNGGSSTWPLRRRASLPPPWLRTHPDTDARIRRLAQLRPQLPPLSLPPNVMQLLLRR